MSKLLPYVKLPPHATIHKFGTPSSASTSDALLRFGSSGWSIARDRREGWAIVGDSEGRRLAVETLLSRHRIHPATPPPGPFPYITSLLESQSSSSSSPSSSSSSADPVLDKNNTVILNNNSKPIRHLAFARPPPSGDFTDFTARYGSLQDEDRLSFRETLSSLHPAPSDEDVGRVARLMNIDHLLDLPFVSFSSGQTRRARIAAGLLSKPVLLVLEDPMAGLDVRSRDQVAKLLGDINHQGQIRVVLVLRGKGGDMPEWITDVCEIRNGDVWIGRRSEYDDVRAPRTALEEKKAADVGAKESSAVSRQTAPSAEPVVRLSNINVTYGEGTRKVNQVLQDVSWTIQPGEKWHLQGANGSGKTTLLSLVLGHHPQSYSLPSECLTLFTKPRRSLPSPTLRKLIGHTSPEIYASFPRGMGLTAFQAIGTGFEGVFSFRSLNHEQRQRVFSVLTYFRDILASSVGRGRTKISANKDGDDMVEEIGKTPFAHFPPPQQALLLFLRAVVSRSPLLILDEPSQGMDEAVWDRCKAFLKDEWEGGNSDQAVVVVSHYEDEVPWGKAAGQIFKLDQGRGSIV